MRLKFQYFLLLLLFSLVWPWAGLYSQDQTDQTNTSTTTPEQSNSIVIERERWEILQNLSMTLETRLMKRVEQVKNLQDLLQTSQNSIASLEEQVQNLNQELRGTSKSLEESENLLETERDVTAEYITELLEQRQQAREERDTELELRIEAENEAKFHKRIWQIGVPILSAAITASFLF